MITIFAQTHPLALENASKVHNYREAWEKADTAQLRDLLDTGVDVNSVNEEGNTLLMIALEYNASPSVIQTLLEAGADPRVRNAEGEFPLQIAALHSEAVTVEALLETVALNDINAEVPGPRWTPLSQAALLGSYEKVQALLEAGADVAHQDVLGATALAYAAGSNPDPEVLNLLIDAGSDVNAKSIAGVTPLMMAVTVDASVEQVKLLLEAGAEPYTRDKNGKRALDYALSNPRFSGEVKATLEALLATP